jgi:Ca2+-binding EF-hand superfamily protein
MEPILPRQDPNGLAQLFANIDIDGSGTLEREEIAEMTKELGNQLTQRELDLAMAEMDEDGSGGVDLEEFAAWLVTPQPSPLPALCCVQADSLA